MYKLRMERVRVDFGNDMFSDAILIEDELFKAKTIPELMTKLEAYLLERGGEISEVDGVKILIDTKDLTIWAKVERTDDKDLDDNEENQIEKLSK